MSKKSTFPDDEHNRRLPEGPRGQGFKPTLWAVGSLCLLTGIMLAGLTIYGTTVSQEAWPRMATAVEVFKVIFVASAGALIGLLGPKPGNG